MGGLANEFGNDIAIDAAGNVYTVGNFGGTADFNYGSADFTITSNGSSDAFLVKYDASGNFVWAKSWGGASNEIAKKIAISHSGSIYVSGTFSSTTDFDPNSGILNLNPIGSNDIFISKFDTSGNIKWAKQLGGASNEDLGNMVLDNIGNIICTGNFLTTADFDPGAGMANLISKGAEDIFISKLDSNGNYVWVKQIGGKRMDLGFSVCTDNLGNIITTGCFADTVDFDPNSGIINLFSKGFYADIFIIKYDPNGNYIWAKQIGGYIKQTGLVITTDANNNIYNLGKFTDSADFDPNAGEYILHSFASGESHYLLKLTPAGNLIWASNFDGASEITPKNITIDKNKNLYVVGDFWETVDFNPSADSFKISSNSDSYDIFMLKLDSMGKFIWVNSFGGTSDDNCNAIKIDNDENIYSTGGYQKDVDFDPSTSSFILSAGLLSDIYIQKLSQNPTSIKKLVEKYNFAIYPNPSTGIFTIQFNNKEKILGLEIYSSTGILVFNTSNITPTLEIDISGFSTGSYFVKARTENGLIMTQKIVKQ